MLDLVDHATNGRGVLELAGAADFVQAETDQCLALAAEAAKLEGAAASKLLAERQAQVEEELSQDEAEFERIRREREELERQLAEMEAVDEPPPPAKTRNRSTLS